MRTFTELKVSGASFMSMAEVWLEFEYMNWHGEDHTYVVTPTSIGYGCYDKSGTHPDMPERPDNKTWVMHGNVVTRDGDYRSDMGPTRKRTFLMSEMRNVREVPRGRS